MRAFHQLAEAFVHGLGAVIFWELVLVWGVGLDGTYLEENEALTYLLYDGLPLLILLLFGVACVLGVVTDAVARSLFFPWEAYLRRSAFPKAKGAEGSSLKPYFDARNFIFSSDQTRAIAEAYTLNRFRIRLCRVWVLHTLAMFVLLAYRESTLEAFNPYGFPLMLLDGMILIGCLIGYHMANINELKWMEPFRG